MLHCHPLSRIGQAALAAVVVAGCLAGAFSCGRTSPLPWPRCDPPEIACGEECRNLLDDPLACGGCDRRCAANEACVNGVCKVTCPAGVTLCNGRCVDLPSDPTNCGQCGVACPTGQACSGGHCAIACPAGFTRCGDQCVNLKTDRQNCSACGQRCDGYPCYFCLDGYCAQTSGTFACPGVTCTDTGNDPKNCGQCGRACATTQSCDYDPALGFVGNCFDRCLAGHTSCGGTCVDIKTDARHCGGCGIACPPCTVCSAGQCTSTAGILRCGRSCESLQLWPAREACSPCSTACDPSGLACQRCQY